MGAWWIGREGGGSGRDGRWGVWISLRGPPGIMKTVREDDGDTCICAERRKRRPRRDRMKMKTN